MNEPVTQRALSCLTHSLAPSYTMRETDMTEYQYFLSSGTRWREPEVGRVRHQSAVVPCCRALLSFQRPPCGAAGLAASRSLGLSHEKGPSRGAQIWAAGVPAAVGASYEVAPLVIPNKSDRAV